MPKKETLKRVKVYLLADAWVDNGTGYCFGEVSESEGPLLVVRNELDQQQELLRARIEGAIQFHRQQETLIVWTDLQGQNIALSFQEKDGCSALCDFIVSVHRGNLAPQISLVSVVSSREEGDTVELITGPINYPPLEPTLDDLPLMFSCFNENPNSSYQKRSIADFIKNNDYIPKLITLFYQCEREKRIKNLHILCNIIKTLILYNESLIIELILDDENMQGVVGILEYDPDYPQYKANHRSYLNDESNFKEVLPVKNDHIKYLIKKTYKLQFLKDVVLARLLDDPTFNLISTLIHFNQVEIIDFLEKSDFIDELFKLYQSNEIDDQQDYSLLKKRNGIKLLHQFILIAKGLQANQKTKFYKSLIKRGLFKTIDFVLKDDNVEIRVIGTELIVSIIEHDVLLINGVMTNEKDEEEHSPSQDSSINGSDSRLLDIPEKEPNNTLGNFFNGDEYEANDDNDDNDNDDNNNERNEAFISGETPDDSVHQSSNMILSDDMTLLLILTQFLLEDNEPGLRIQAYEALKSLLDPLNNVNSSSLISDDSIAEKLNATNYFKAFYSIVAPKLFAPLIELKEMDENETIDSESYEHSSQKDELFIYLCELINFCSKDKPISRAFFMENHILIGITKLIKPLHKLQLRLAAIRSLKSIVQLNDEYYMRYIISNDFFREIFELFKETNGIPDLTYSTILDLLEVILLGIDKGDSRKNFKLLAHYVVTNFKEELESIETVNSGQDLIKFVENSQTKESKELNNNNNDDEDDDFDDMLTRQEITTEPLLEDDVIFYEEETNGRLLNFIEEEAEEERSVPKNNIELLRSRPISNENISNNMDHEHNKEDEVSPGSLQRKNSVSSLNSLSSSKSSISDYTQTNAILKDKRLREDDSDLDLDQFNGTDPKKKNGFKEKFTNAGKKFASRFSSK